MSKTKPLVSVIMPVYNAGEFLVEAIESILHQTYKNFEFIIVDDGSKDNSWKILRMYRKKYPKKIKIFRLKKQTNYAGNSAVNYGMKFAKGEFIVRMDADDVSLPKRLEKQVEYMLSHPDVVLLGTQAYVIDEKGKIAGKKEVPLTHEKIYEEYGVVHPVIHPSCMFRRSLLPSRERIYERKFGVNSDYYTFFRLLKYAKFANLSEYLLKYRVHERNFSFQDPKGKFLNSVKIRLSAIMDFDYQISVRAMFLMLIQSLVILFLPEKLIVPLYMGLRGMSDGTELLDRVKVHLSQLMKRTYLSFVGLFL